MFSLLRRMRSTRNTNRQKATSYRLSLETLEDRTLLTNYVPVDFSAHHNTRFHDLQPPSRGLPEGDVVLGGIPFSIPTGGRNAWWGEAATGPYPRSIDVNIGRYGVREVHTLINTSYGQPGPVSYVALEFYGSSNAFFRKEFIGNVDVRDHFYAYWTNSINDTTTINVARSGSGFLNESRLNKQQIDLPSAFSSQTLDRIRFIDSGGVLISGIILQGLTVDVPDVSGCKKTTPQFL